MVVPQSPERSESIPPVRWRRQWRPLLLSIPILTIVTGIGYPLALAAIARPLFPQAAAGSLVRAADGSVFGAATIGQPFAAPRYFHPRPSAAGSGYDATASGGSNLAPTASKLLDGTVDDPATPADESFVGIRTLAANYRRENGLAADAPVPVDAVTRSASGLDPHISPANARLQAARVAHARGLALDRVLTQLARHTERPWLGLIGQPRASVLELNLALDAAPAP